MSDSLDSLRTQIDEHLALAQAFRDTLLPKIEAVAQVMIESLCKGGRVLTCGNGGSACDALHLAEELAGRYRRERRPLAGMSLAADPTAMTCIGNDYGFENVFARQVQAHARTGDVVVGISTSGNSENVLRAMDAARELGAVTVALLGRDGGRIAPRVAHPLIVPSQTTARVQEMHVVIVHMLCERIDDWVLG